MNRKSMTFPKIVQKYGGRKQETGSLVHWNSQPWLLGVENPQGGGGKWETTVTKQPTRLQQCGSDSQATAEIRGDHILSHSHAGRTSCDSPATRY